MHINSITSKRRIIADLKILYLCHRIPYPPRKGDKIRSYNTIKYLSRTHDIYLGTILGQNSDVKYIRKLKPFCKSIFTCKSRYRFSMLASFFNNKPLSVGNFYKKELQQYVVQILETEKIDAIFCFCSSMAEYVFRTPGYATGKLSGIKLIMDYVDLDSDKWHQYAQYSKALMSWIYRVENRRLFDYEKKINQAFDHSIFVAQREVNIFKKQYPAVKNISVVPNGVRQDYFFPKSQTRDEFDKKRGPALVFTGVMDYFANEDGVIWFATKIFPLIKEKIPDVKFYIVGDRPTRQVKKLEQIDGVVVTGYVDNIREYYWMADICVIPLRIARGLQNKVLEAMACRRPVIATSNASEGIICSHGEDIIISNDEKDFAQQTINLLNDHDKQEAISNCAYKNIKTNYLWEKKIQLLENLLEND